MQTGPMMRTRKSQKRYIQGGLWSKECPFCQMKEKDPREIHEETTHFYRVENIFGYDIWDNHTVAEHQLIVPKRHITSLSELNETEAAEYMTLIQNAEAAGYNVYARAKNGPTKSVAHLHTHLIKLDTKKVIKWMVYLQRPHSVLFSTRHK